MATGLLKRVTDPILSIIARDARDALSARWAGICIVIDERQHVIASSGGMLGIYRRSTALSSYVVSNPDEAFVALDPASDERFAGNPFVADGVIRFYAGAAIRDSSGYAIGALCITDGKPRQAFTPAEAAILSDLASMTVDA